MEELFDQLQDDTRSFWQSPSGGVRRLDRMPSTSDFFRDYVATSTPVIISGGASTCLKASRGAWEDLPSLAGRGGAGKLEVTVDFTPNGRGDCVVDVPRSMLSEHSTRRDGNSSADRADAASGESAKEEEGSRRGCTGGALGTGGVDLGEPAPAPAPAPEATVSTAVAGATAVFVKPEERRMKFETFVGMLLAEGERESPCGSGFGVGGGEGVPYLSHQNDSLRQEFPGLMEDVEPFLALAGEAFGNEPDAVNLWIGDDRSVSAVHKDHYENMYCVVRGEKLFTLLPPSDVLFLYEQEYPSGRYRYRQRNGENGGRGGFEVELEGGTTVPWIPVDPACPDLDKYPLFRHASPIQCRVGPGDILYLPALWYHRVAQKGITIAVNYWHDMQFDHKYVYYRFLQTLAAKHRTGLLPPPPRLPTGGGTESAEVGRSLASPFGEVTAAAGVDNAGGKQDDGLCSKSGAR
eukprot:g9685.t1